jgi:hypothetical protein
MTDEPRNNAGETPPAVGRRGRPFASGNPGRPKGARHKSTLAIEALLEGQATAIGQKCVAMALAGDTTALRLVMERIAPTRRGRPVRFDLPALNTATDLGTALGAVLRAVAGGALTAVAGDVGGEDRCKFAAGRLARWRGRERRLRVDLTPCVLPQRTAANGASRPLPFVSAKVPCLITQRTFSQRGGNGSSCPIAVTDRAAFRRMWRGKEPTGSRDC